MTPTEFNVLNFKAGDRIEVTFDNGTKDRFLLFDSTATQEVPARTTYLGGNTVPAIPSKIVVQCKESGGEKGLVLSTIISIEKVGEL